MDLLLQSTTQSHCHRIVRYFDRRGELQVFPAGPFADSAAELGPCNHKHGPCLVQFSNMQLSPQQFNAWFKGSFVERTISRVYWLQRSIPAEADKASLYKAIIAADIPEGLTAVRLDVYPRVGELQMGDELFDAGYTAPMKPSGYSHVLFIVRMPDTGLWRWSYMERGQVWRNACDQPARFNTSVATAINKIAEAMHVLGLAQPPAPHSSSNSVSCNGAVDHSSCQPQQQPHQQLCVSQRAGDEQQQQQQQGQAQQVGLAQPAAANGQQEQQQQQQRWAVDVGACPGGWTSYLSDRGFSVVAIDPALLHPDVLARPGVHQIQAKAVDALEGMDSLLQGGQADLMVCDANSHVACLPQFLGPVLHKLRPGGWLVLTLKFHGRGLKSDDVAQMLGSALPGLEPGKVLWLLANTLCERTFAARKL